MTGTILDVIDGGSIWLRVVDAGDLVVEQPVEPRHMADIVEAEALGSPHDLVGREIEMTDDGLTIGLA